MKNVIIPVALLLMLSSCASIFNSPYTTVKLYSSKPTTIEVRYEKYTVDGEKHIYAKRQNQPLHFQASTDSATRKYELKPHSSFWYIISA